MNWISDQIARTLRTIFKEVATEIEVETEYARETWRRMRNLLDRALMPYPEARVALLRAFEEEIDRLA